MYVAPMTVRFGVFVPQGWKMDLNEIADPVEQYEAMTAVGRAADAGPWDSIWVYDHFHTVPEQTANTTFECWTSTAALARDTSRVNIGQMVGCNGYRNPALYAKIASTVDVASHGRLYVTASPPLGAHGGRDATRTRYRDEHRDRRVGTLPLGMVRP